MPEVKTVLVLERDFPEVFKLILKRDKNWLPKAAEEKLEVINLIRKDLLLPAATLSDGIVSTLRQMEDRILFLEVMKAP